MRSDIYAARTANARGAIATSLSKLDGAKGFEDVPTIWAGTSSKDKDAQILFEREAIAVIVERLVSAATAKPKGKAGEQIAELQGKVDELTAANAALFAGLQAAQALLPAPEGDEVKPEGEPQQ